MKIPKQCKIEKAASKDFAREVLNYVLIDTQDGESNAIATNGKMLAIVPVTICEGDHFGKGKLIALKALTEARKQAKQAKESTIGLNGAATMPDGATYPVPEYLQADKYPNWRQIVPDNHSVEYMTVRFDAKLLFELSQAIGAVNNHVTLKIPVNAPPMQPLVIEEKTTGAKGILMPCREN
jgi:DNA polymerase III sliding clamp (beta) subunit (PCNA family)